MNNTIKSELLIAMCLLGASGAAFAVCPDSLSADMMSECIMIEGSEELSYQEWQQQFNNIDKVEKASNTAGTGSQIKAGRVTTAQATE